MQTPTHSVLHPALACISIVAMFSSVAVASELKDLLPLTDRILMLYFEDGHIQYHQRGEPRSGDKVFTNPLDVKAAAQPGTFSITSTSDPAFQQPVEPASIGRKSKGIEFAWFVDSMVDGITVNARPDHILGHWIYLELPFPLKPGDSYTLNTGALAKNGSEWNVDFDPTKTRSEAVHVNTLGYLPSAPSKFGYVYHWMGDKGALDVPDLVNRPFHLIDSDTGEKMFTGKVQFRMKKDQPETQHLSDSPPHGNFLNADVWECDFSGFNREGNYVLAVDGIGCSWPFRLAKDIYDAPYRATARALYHNRSGIALTKPYTEFERPVPHHPRLTPGFEGKLFYSTIPWMDWGSEGGDPEKLKATSKGILEDTWGWYQDAGDWDGYATHLRVPQELLFAYELAPKGFADGDLNIPESGNGVPDILDEAAWLPRYCQRLRQELMAKNYGTGGVSLRVAGDAFGSDEKILPNGTRVGQGSWEDVNREWVVSGENPSDTFRYAGVAAHLAHALNLSGKPDPKGVDWKNEAVESYEWAVKNTTPEEEKRHINNYASLRDLRAYAAAALFRLTGEDLYHQQFLRDMGTVRNNTILTDDRRYAAWVYALGGGKGEPDPEALHRLRSSVLATAKEVAIETPSKRALRWGGNFSMPMLIGQQTTPWVLEGAVGHIIARDSDPELATQLLAGLLTTCDYFLGTNALNQTWITGIGPRHPTHIFHMDAWYNGKGKYHDGLIPYSPWRKEKERGRGPWDQDWGNNFVHPHIDEWPGNERWWNNRCSPMGSEFTVHQNIGPSAALYGFLSGMMKSQ